jgi:hypothetical protein
LATASCGVPATPESQMMSSKAIWNSEPGSAPSTLKNWNRSSMDCSAILGPAISATGMVAVPHSPLRTRP